MVSESTKNPIDDIGIDDLKDLTDFLQSTQLFDPVFHEPNEPMLRATIKDLDDLVEFLQVTQVFDDTEINHPDEALLATAKYYHIPENRTLGHIERYCYENDENPPARHLSGLEQALTKLTERKGWEEIKVEKVSCDVRRQLHERAIEYRKTHVN